MEIGGVSPPVLAARADPRRAGATAARATLALFTLAIFLSSGLTFWAEPMAAKMILPLLGGSPAVWNTALVFFQVVLFAGYLYTFLLSRALRPAAQLVVHLVLLGAALVALPPTLAPDVAASAEAPIASVLSILARCLGVPFFALCTTAPLLQLWFSATRHDGARDPYFLYAASNAGSFAGLLAYPLVIEPLIDLDRQAVLWAIGFCATAAAVIAAGAVALRAPHAPASAVGSTPADAGAAPGLADRLRWLVLAFVPSSLLVGVTSYITTDIAAVPLLWVVPLALYLATFVVTFARRPVIRHRWAVHGQAAAMVALVVVARYLGLAPLPTAGLHLLAFLFAALTCHGELARRRPGAAWLTEFYLWLAGGGVLGGIFNAIVAPLAFTSTIEYSAVLLAACALRPALFGNATNWRADLALLLVLAAALGAAWGVPAALPGMGAPAVIALAAVLGSGLLICSARPLPFVLAVVAASTMAPSLATSDAAFYLGPVLHAERSFFGIYRVRTGPEDRLTLLLHGTTLHGAEFADPARRREPLTYFHRAGPFGDVFGTAAPRRSQVAVIGLGAGALACYARPGEDWTFFEIDPAVERIARDTRFFHFLADCAPPAPVVIGDGRVSLRGVADGSLDLLVVDAFSSDSIPVHLLTREAVALYVRKLAPGGMLAIHITNRFFDLKRVLLPIAAAEGLAVRGRDFVPEIGVEASRDGIGPAFVLALARDDAALRYLDTQPGWATPEPVANGALWTDRFSNILAPLRSLR